MVRNTKYFFVLEYFRAKLLTDMGKAPVFNCGQLCDRAFLIEEQHLPVSGYGLDRSGSDKYLQDTLAFIKVIMLNYLLLNLFALRTRVLQT